MSAVPAVTRKRDLRHNSRKQRTSILEPRQDLDLEQRLDSSAGRKTIVTQITIPRDLDNIRLSKTAFQ